MELEGLAKLQKLPHLTKRVKAVLLDTIRKKERRIRRLESLVDQSKEYVAHARRLLTKPDAPSP